MKKQATDKYQIQKRNVVGFYMGMGIAAGSALGASLGKLAIGIAIGAVLGAAFGAIRAGQLGYEDKGEEQGNK